jgi:lipoic acid synthetase
MSMLQAPGDHGGLPSLPVLEGGTQPARGPLTARPDGAGASARRLPEWLKRPIPAAGGIRFTRNLVSELGLETVCESARCPNRSECWTRRTATS